MQKFNHPVEKHVKTITYKGVEFDVVERPDVILVGCVDYAKNNTDEADNEATFKRFEALYKLVPVSKEMNPGFSAALSINYTRNDKPCGYFCGNETYSEKQDERYDLFTQPGGLWLKIHVTKNSDFTLLGRLNNGLWEYFAQDILQSAAKENGYVQNPDVHVQIEYNIYAVNDAPYAYIPIIAV